MRNAIALLIFNLLLSIQKVLYRLPYLLYKFKKELDIYHGVWVKGRRKLPGTGTRRTGCLPNEGKCRNTAETIE